MHASLPEQERRRPGYVCVELVVQTSRTQASHHHSCQDRCQDELWRYSAGDVILLLLRRRRQEEALDTKERDASWSQPLSVQKSKQQDHMGTQQRDGKRLRQKGLLSDKAPVDRPLKHELPTELESLAEIAARIRAEELIA